MKSIKRFFNAPDNNASFFIFGPRGTGKSTWLKFYFPNAFTIDLLNNSDYLRHLSNPNFLQEIVDGNPNCRHFIIDEIQKIPDMLNTVHRLMEQYKEKGLQFIMTGSSARKLRRAGVNLLGGRALVRYFHPFMARELGALFDLESALQYGLIPLIVSAPNKQDTLNAYLSIYLKEEVQSESLVRNLSSFSRFLEIMSFSHGSILNLNNIARECQITRKIAENYLSILIDLLIAEKLPVFKKRAERETVSHEKFYYFDTGIYSNSRPKGPLDRPEEVYGIALEGLVFQHLRAWRDYTDQKIKLYYWRTKSGAEVDFIIYSDQHFYAIEVKNHQIVHSKDLRHLKAFSQTYPEATPILLHRGKEQIKIDGVFCYPVTEFLMNLKPGFLL